MRPARMDVKNGLWDNLPAGRFRIAAGGGGSRRFSMPVTDEFV